MLHQSQKLNMKDGSVRGETMKLLEGSPASKLLDKGLNNNFLDRHRKHKEQNQKQTSGTVSNSTSAQQERPSTK